MLTGGDARDPVKLCLAAGVKHHSSLSLLHQFLRFTRKSIPAMSSVQTWKYIPKTWKSMLKQNRNETTTHTVAMVIAIFLSNVGIFLVKKRIIQYQTTQPTPRDQIGMGDRFCII